MRRYRATYKNKSHLIMIAAALSLVAVSVITMYSATATLSLKLAMRHTFWVCVGIFVFIIVSRTNYRNWTDGAALIYGASVALLCVVMIAGAMRLGATRWLSIFGVSFQPSEFSKLASILILAHYLGGQTAPLSLKSFFISALLVMVPTCLIFIQPDLGSSSILVVIWLAMVWVAGIPQRVFWTMAAGGVALMPLGWFLMKEYQRSRIMVFLDPYADPLGAGFSIIQSTIAIGSGGLFGRGWKAGTQNQLNFLPEHHSDFIFSVIGEEWGFIGCLLVVTLFSVLLIQILRIAHESLESQGRLMVIGVFSWIAYQTFVNMGMVMGLLPVVGVPLPMISFGGSSMLMIWIGLGLIYSVRRSAR